MSKIVVALGGNALGSTPIEQLEIVKKTAESLVELVEMGHEIVITHGNGPQVGMIYNAMSLVDPKSTLDDMPFAECGAMSQGYIGYHLQQALEAEFKKRNMRRRVVTIVSQVEVSPDDPAFLNPTKPIGVFYDEKTAVKLAKESGAIYKEDAGRGFRRVVPSPIPKKICEIGTIKKLIEERNTVITCGGGGIPVVREGDGYKGVDAVIDKDRTSALLASQIDADILLILTAIDQVKINFNKEDEKSISLITVDEAKTYISNGEFAKGSMLPKVEACLSFLNASPDKKAIIASLNNTKNALLGKSGTVIINKK